MLRAFFYSERADQSPWLLNSSSCRPHLTACCRPVVSDRGIHSNALIVTEDLTNKVVAWATAIAGYAAQLPSKQAREGYLRERRHELMKGVQAQGATPRDAAIVADACVDAARRIMTELLALWAGAPQGRA
jgi:hypothetical protein